MFSCYLPFLLPLHHLSSPVTAVHLSPTVLFMSGVGAFSTMSAANRKADRLQGQQLGWGGGVIWKDRPSHYHHAYRESSTATGAQHSDKPPTQTSATVRPHSLQWMAQTRHSTWLSFPGWLGHEEKRLTMIICKCNHETETGSQWTCWPAGCGPSAQLSAEEWRHPGEWEQETLIAQVKL